MDEDQSGTIDRIEWVSYLSAPIIHDNAIGNIDYYDFKLLDLFERIDRDNSGSMDFEELCDYIKSDMGEVYEKLDQDRKLSVEHMIKKLAKQVNIQLKQQAYEVCSPFLKVNNDLNKVNWVEFRGYRLVCKAEKTELATLMVNYYHQQMTDQFLKIQSVSDASAQAATDAAAEQTKASQLSNKDDAQKQEEEKKDEVQESQTHS